MKLGSVWEGWSVTESRSWCKILVVGCYSKCDFMELKKKLKNIVSLSKFWCFIL